MKLSICKYRGFKLFPMAFLFIFAQAIAQPPDTSWLKTYGGPGSDAGRTLIQTTDQGYLIAGSTWSFGPGRNDVYLIKTTSNGDTLWTRAFGSLFSDSYASVVETGDTNYIIAYTRGLTTGNADIGLIKVNSAGDTSWTRSYGSMTVDGCYDLQQTSDNGFVLVGWTYSGGGGSNVYLIRTDAFGDTLWSKIYGGDEDDYGYSIEPTNDQGYIIAGYTNSYGGGDYDIYIIKTDMNGDTIWTSVLGGNADDFAYGVMQTSDSNYVVVGATWSYGHGTPANSNSFIVKYNSSGDTLWTRNFGGLENERAYSLHQTQFNDIVIVGYTDSYGAGGFDIYLLKVDSNGDTLWTTTYGGSDYDYGFSIVQNSDTGYTIVGSTLSYGAGDYDVILLKTEPDLKILEKKRDEKYPCNISVHPNPFTHKININWPGDLGQNNFVICDITGRIVRKFNALTNHVVWFGDDDQGNALPTGIYCIIHEHSSLYQTQIITHVK